MKTVKNETQQRQISRPHELDRRIRGKQGHGQGRVLPRFCLNAQQDSQLIEEIGKIIKSRTGIHTEQQRLTYLPRPPTRCIKTTPRIQRTTKQHDRNSVDRSGESTQRGTSNLAHQARGTTCCCGGCGQCSLDSSRAEQLFGHRSKRFLGLKDQL